MQPPPDARAWFPESPSPERTAPGVWGGFYDRFLDTFGGMTVGLAFEVQLAPSCRLPTVSSVDSVVTEARWYPIAPETAE